MSPGASTLRDEMAMSGQRLLAASGQVPMAAHTKARTEPSASARGLGTAVDSADYRSPGPRAAPLIFAGLQEASRAATRPRSRLGSRGLAFRSADALPIRFTPG